MHIDAHPSIRPPTHPSIIVHPSIRMHNHILYNMYMCVCMYIIYIYIETTSNYQQLPTWKYPHYK